MQDLNLILLAQKGRYALKYLLIYLAIAGTVTFSLFILEESFQTVMFGTWPAADVGRWDIVLSGTKHMQRIQKITRVLNYSCGWIQPLAFISYNEYQKSMGYYIDSLHAKVLANAPHLMTGKQVSMDIKVQQFKPFLSGFLINATGVKVFVKGRPANHLSVSGVLKDIEGVLILDTTGRLTEERIK